MANVPNYVEVKSWFDTYFQTYLQQDNLSEDDLDALTLKHKHSYRVKELMETIGKALHLSVNDLEIAKIIGILHDVARFFQYSTYHTMNDAHSLDHGDQGAKIILEFSPIQQLDLPIQLQIAEAVRNHNKMTLPSNLSEKQLLFCRMIRDADKLDVFALAVPIYQQYPDELGERLKMHLPSNGNPSPQVIRSFLSKNPINFGILENMTDFKLLQLAWIFDFNFPISFHILQENHYWQAIFHTLSPFPEREVLHQRIIAYIAEFTEKKT